MANESRTVLVPGSCIGGIVTATQLRKRLPEEYRNEALQDGLFESPGQCRI